MSEKERDEIMGSIWRDEFGNHWRVFSAAWVGDDPDLRLHPVPPPEVKAALLSELRASCVALPRQRHSSEEDSA